MRTFMKWAVVLSVPAVFGATARPTEPAVPEGTTIKLLLLRQKSVQKELDLTPEAAKKIMDFTNAQAEAYGKALDLAEAARKEAFEKLLQQNDKFLADNLNAKQSKRLDQITMQFTALTQLTKPEMAKELKLSDEQVKKFKDLQTEARKALVDIIEAKERAGKSEKLAKLREETRKTILAVLTDEQQKKVREIAGPPFEGEIVFEEPESKDKLATVASAPLAPAVEARGFRNSLISSPGYRLGGKHQSRHFSPSPPPYKAANGPVRSAERAGWTEDERAAWDAFLAEVRAALAEACQPPRNPPPGE